jgi:hypothetical protein
MTNQEIFNQVNFWIKANRLSFDDIQKLGAVAYEFEAKCDASSSPGEDAAVLAYEDKHGE